MMKPLIKQRKALSSIKPSIFLGLFCIALYSCSYLAKDNSEDIVAKVNEKYLYKQDLIEPTKAAKNSEDSILLANQYINRWALENLLLEKAKINLPKSQQAKFDELADNYRYELYTQAYKDALVDKAIEDSISESDIKAYYEEHKDNFKTNENLLKIRYLHLTKNLLEFDKIKEHFFRFNDSDKVALENRGLEFKDYMLNDSIWIRSAQIFKTLPLEKEISQDEFLNGNKFEIEDSTSVYLVKIKDVLEPKSIAPLSYIKPTIEQIISNKNKLKIKSKIEKEVLDDATNSNEFKVFKK
ncbi:MAG: peptidyl-prolyl cis-trans isomerase [Bacteroidota bacterium]